MTDELGDLSPDEVALIRQRRAENSRREQQLEFRLEAIKVAAEYETWLQANKCGDSFSTFINEFGYQEPQGSIMHHYVTRIRKAATPD